MVDLFFFFPLTKVLLRLTSFWRLKAVSFWCLQHGRPAPPRRICTQGASCFCDLSSSFCKAFLGGLSVLVMRVDVELGVTSCWRLSDGGSGRAPYTWGPGEGPLLPECEVVITASREWRGWDLNPGQLASILPLYRTV